MLAACSTPPPVETRFLWRSELTKVIPADLDGDSTDELVCTHSDFVLDCYSQDMMRAVGGTVYRDRGVLGAASLAGGSMAAGIWYTFVRHDSLFLFSTLAGQDVFVVCGRDSLPPAGWDGGASNVMVRDSDGDGDLEAVIEVVSRMDAYPRGIYVIGYASGCRLWSFQTGPPPVAASLVDIDGDSRLEVLAGSGAYMNGGSANGTSDSFSYVFLLGDGGKAKWVTRIGRYSSVVYASRCRSGAERHAQVVAYEVGNEVGGRTGDSVFLLDARDGSITSRRQFGRFTNSGSVGYRADGSTLLALAGSDETLRVLGESLRVEAKAWVPGGVRRVLAGRFSGMGSLEWAVVTVDGRLILLDSTLGMLSRSSSAEVNADVGLRLVKNGAKDRLLVEILDYDRPRWLLYDFSPTPLLRQGVPLGLVISLSAVMLLGFAVIIAASRSRQTRDMRAVVRGLTGQAGVVELGNRGQVRHANPRARELLGGEAVPAGPLSQAVKAVLAEPPGSEPRELPVALEGGKTVLARAARVRSGVMLTLEDISAVEYLKRVSTWVPVAQRLAHDIKNPLTAISLTLQWVEQATGPGSQRYVESMRDDIDRLKKMADGFMRLTKLEPPKLVPADVNEVVRECVGRFHGVRPAGVEFKYELAEGMPRLALDRDQMAVALSNVIENAISAMGNVGRLVIRSSFIVEENRVLEVRPKSLDKRPVIC